MLNIEVMHGIVKKINKHTHMQSISLNSLNEGFDTAYQSLGVTAIVAENLPTTSSLEGKL